MRRLKRNVFLLNGQRYSGVQFYAEGFFFAHLNGVKCGAVINVNVFFNFA